MSRAELKAFHKKQKELNEIAAINMDNLTDPELVAKSQEMDIEVNKYMYKINDLNSEQRRGH